MTIEEFRTNPVFVESWRNELENNHTLRMVLGLMEDNHPARFVIAGDNDGDLSPTRAAVELGMTRGYSKFGDTLKLLARQKTKLSDIGEPTYAPQPVEEKQNA